MHEIALLHKKCDLRAQSTLRVHENAQNLTKVTQNDVLGDK